MNRIHEAVEELESVFRTAPSKHDAHRAAAPIMEQLTRAPAFLTGVLERYLRTPGSLERKNYPVVSVKIALNPWFALIANCWIPLPGRETHISTKAIHHHGDLLLTTATLFGPGYEHWMFSRPREVDGARGLFAMELLEAAPHPMHHVSFVDAWIAHTPFYPKDLSITLALWSSQHRTGWRDHLKRLPLLRDHADVPRRVAVKLGLRKALDLKVVESFDFFPTASGFRVMREREEFALGPNEDHLQSVFHILQRTGNEHLARVARREVERRKLPGPVDRLLRDLETSRPIEGRLSVGHFDIPHANFTRDDVYRALGARKGMEQDGREFAAAQDRQEAPRAGAD